jgi:hypothetical protein
MKKLIQPVASEALINGVRECSLWRDLYALPDRSLIRVKQVMENHIRVLAGIERSINILSRDVMTPIKNSLLGSKG